jgi:hypothetical protein
VETSPLAFQTTAKKGATSSNLFSALATDDSSGDEKTAETRLAVPGLADASLDDAKESSPIEPANASNPFAQSASSPLSSGAFGSMTVQGDKNQSEKASPSVNATNHGSSLFENAAPAFSSSGSAFSQAPSASTDLKTTPQQNPFSNAPSAFGGSSNSAFGARSTTQPSTTPATGGAFGTTNTTTSNVFGSLAATNAAQNGEGFFGAPPTSAFGSLSAPGSAFSNGPSSQDVAQNHQAEGAPPEELAVSTTRVEYVQGSNQEDPPDLSRLGDSLVAAFKATKFDLGKVPDIIPPLEYR